MKFYLAGELTKRKTEKHPAYKSRTLGVTAFCFKDTMRRNQKHNRTCIEIMNKMIKKALSL